MSPPVKLIHWPTRSFPRVSGDEPSYDKETNPRPVFSPRERG